MAPIGEALDRLAVNAAATPEKPAIIDDRPDGYVRLVSFSELNELVNRIANALVKVGFGSGERLVWAGRNCVEVIAIQHAVRKAGGFSIALNHRLTKKEVHAIVRVAEPTFVWTAGAFREFFTGQEFSTLRGVVVFDGEALPGQSSMEEFIGDQSTDEPTPIDNPRAGFDPILIFTSGTTGLPKGVVRYGLGESEVRLQTGLLGDGDGVFVVTGSLSHGGPNGMGNNSLLIGGSIVLQQRFDAEDWMRLVEKYRVTNSYSAPFPIRHICGLPDAIKRRYDASSLKTMIAAAAQWPHALKEAFLEAFPECSLWELYGSSELATVTVQAPKDQLRKPGSCGLPAPGVEILLVDEEGQVIREPHCPGILYAKSDSVYRGYLGDDEAYAESLLGDFATTQDVAYFDEEGFYYICDRKKDMLISGGANIYPKEIENALESHPGIFESAVIGLPDEDWGERPHALIVPNPDVRLEGEEILEFCRDNLASYKVPNSLEFVDELPHMVSGKLDKRAIRDRYGD
ncbi:AMP-binding protein [Myxococcota bacterium]|nr:AMP-binding protein [Myxococcota bacterium]